MRYIGLVFITPIAFLLISIARDEALLSWRVRERNEDPKEQRKKMYPEILIFWAITTVGWFIFLIFFA